MKTLTQIRKRKEFKGNRMPILGDKTYFLFFYRYKLSVIT